jgi:hypothetical protein
MLQNAIVSFIWQHKGEGLDCGLRCGILKKAELGNWRGCEDRSLLCLYIFSDNYEGKTISKLQMDIELKQIRVLI